MTSNIDGEIVQAVQRDFFDEDAIRCAIQDADERHAMGAISAKEYEAIVDALVGRLVAARTHPGIRA